MTPTLLLVSKFGIAKTSKAWEALLVKGVASCFRSEAPPTNPTSCRNGLLSRVAFSGIEFQEGQSDGVPRKIKEAAGKFVEE